MICEKCGKDKPLTYRSAKLGLRSVCGPCIRLLFPETVQGLAVNR